MEEILIWVVVADTLLTLFIWLFSPKPLTQTYFEINKISVKDIEDAMEEVIKEPNEALRREIVEQRLKMQDYHLRQKIKNKKDEERNEK
jgi:hypothetical protein